MPRFPEMSATRSPTQRAHRRERPSGGLWTATGRGLEPLAAARGRPKWARHDPSRRKSPPLARPVVRRALLLSGERKRNVPAARAPLEPTFSSRGLATLYGVDVVQSHGVSSDMVRCLTASLSEKVAPRDYPGERTEPLRRGPLARRAFHAMERCALSPVLIRKRLA